MKSFRRFFRLSNLGTLVFFALNLSLLLAIFTGGFTNIDAIIPIVVAYVVSVGISLSPVGEWFLALLVGAKEIRRAEVKIKVVPLLEIVYNKAKQTSPDMVNSIRLKIVHDASPNAFALGRHTICITDGLLELSDDMIMGVLAHEIGHIVYHHSALQLLIGGSNILITGFLLILKGFALMISAIFAIFAIKTRRLFVGAIIAFTGALFTIAVWLWTKFCMLFLMASMRANEYVADEYAYTIGFGYQLAYVLDSVMTNKPENGLLRALYSTHPDNDDRVARLQGLGVGYFNNNYRYSVPR